MRSRVRRQKARSMFSTLRSHRRKQRGNFARTSFLGFESLENRTLLAADLTATDFTTNGTDLVVDYSITGENVGSFDISIYRSSNGTSLSSLLTTKRITASADRQVGSHTTTIAANFNDVQQDYYLIVKLDKSSEISETNESNNTLRLDEGVFRTSDGAVHVQGSDSADSVNISIASGNLTVNYNGNQYVYTESGVPIVKVRSHAGDDTITMAATANKIMWGFGGAGNDTISCGAADDLVTGGVGDDYVYGYGGNDYLVGEDGNDVLYGGDGNDTLCGMNGNDVHYGGAGNDLIVGGAGNDSLYGEDGDDSLSGDAGNDLLEGGAGNDLIEGGLGADTVIFRGSGNLGTDQLTENHSMSTGDTLDFSELNNGINLDLTCSNGTTQTVNSQLDLKIFYYASVENVIGTAQDDVIIGNANANIIDGGDGDDWIEGGEGDDVLMGGAGEDYLFGQQGHDIIYGGDGEDHLYGDDVCFCYGGNDFLFGDDGDDYLYGGLGDDYLDGGSGVDSLFGDDGNNEVADRPKILDFNYQFVDGGFYLFTGRVEDDADTEGLVMTFGGLLQGRTATVNEDGTFSLLVDPDAIEYSGNVTAETTDAEGLTSETANVFVWGS